MTHNGKNITKEKIFICKMVYLFVMVLIFTQTRKCIDINGSEDKYKFHIELNYFHLD